MAPAAARKTERGAMVAVGDVARESRDPMGHRSECPYPKTSKYADAPVRTGAVPNSPSR